MIRQLFKWTFRLVILVVVLVTVVALGHNTILRLLLERRLQAATGFETTVGRVNLSWTRPLVKLEHVRLFNPDELGGKPFVDILEADIRYDFTDLFSQEFRIRELRIKLGDIRLVRIDPLTSTQLHLARHRKAASPIGTILLDPLSYTGTDTLTVNADRYLYTDYVEVFRTQHVVLGIRDLKVQYLDSPEDWTKVLGQIAAARGIRRPPLMGPTLSLPQPLLAPPALQMATNAAAEPK